MSEGQLVSLVRGVDRVRVVGSSWGPPEHWASTGIIIRLRHDYNRIVNFGGSTVTVQAGISQGELSRYLRQHGMMLPIFTGSDGSTMGAMFASGSVSASPCRWLDNVTEIRVVQPGGVVHTIGHDDETFPVFYGSQGLLGIISAITFRVIRHMHVQSHEIEMPLEEFQRMLSGPNSTIHEQFESSASLIVKWYVPLNMVHVRRTTRVDGNEPRWAAWVGTQRKKASALPGALFVQALALAASLLPQSRFVALIGSKVWGLRSRSYGTMPPSTNPPGPTSMPMWRPSGPWKSSSNWMT